MNDFLIFKHNEILIANAIKLTDRYSVLFRNKEQELYVNNNERFYILGDLISERKELNDLLPADIKNLKGNFYLIRISGNSIEVINSLFSVLPIYYTDEFKLISSDLNWIISKSPNQLTPDKKFILECLLFNYGFFNRTLYEEIHLVPTNSLIEITDLRHTIKRHFEVKELFKTEIKKDKQQLNRISDLFIETSKHYFPDKNFHIAFTSGFDGRTLVSCATFFKKHFKTFSFGRRENDDVRIPRENANELKLDYTHFDLGSENYLNKHYLENALEYIQNSNGGNGFIYAHVLRSTKEIAKDSDYLMAGYAGSELFRALHIQGAVSSKTLVDFFKSKNGNEIRELITNAEVLKYLNISEFKKEMNELVEELITYKKQIPENLSENQKFYAFVFDEIIRKFFGQWISVLQNTIKVRTPFLDYSFINSLLETEFAGVNMDFLTQNPYKRMKGQLVYPMIIKKTNKTIYYQKTGKGYRPVDILNKFYFINVVISFVFKRIKRRIKKTNVDHLGIVCGASKLMELISIKENKFFQTDLINNDLANLKITSPEKERDSLLMSLALLLRYEKNNSLN